MNKKPRLSNATPLRPVIIQLLLNFRSIDTVSRQVEGLVELGINAKTQACTPSYNSKFPTSHWNKQPRLSTIAAAEIGFWPCS